MSHKKVLLVVSCLFFISPVIASHELQEPVDLIAYRSGELVAELTFEAWIEAARQRRNEVIVLAQKIAQVGEEYSMSLNRSFLQGYRSCLEKKDPVPQLEIAQLTRYQCALVLACHFYWILQLGYAFHGGNFEFHAHPELEQEALEKATIALYGEPVPEIIKELTYALEHDLLGLGDSNF